MVDGVTYLSEAVSSISAKPTKIVSSWVADQIAPTYWMPNFKITNCGICDKEFEELDQKHHCRLVESDCATILANRPGTSWPNLFSPLQKRLRWWLL